MCKLTISALFLSLLCSCVTRGKDFSSRVEWIKIGETTKEDITSTMGAPYAVGFGSGKPTWTYGYYNLQLFGESHTKELKLYWEGDTVTNFSFSTSFPADIKNAL